MVVQSFTSRGVVSSVPLEVSFSNGQILKWDLEELRQKIQDLRQGDLFWAALILFFLGVLLQIVGLVDETHAKKLQDIVRSTNG
jgi:hypothetical protein